MTLWHTFFFLSLFLFHPLSFSRSLALSLLLLLFLIYNFRRKLKELSKRDVSKNLTTMGFAKHEGKRPLLR